MSYLRGPSSERHAIAECWEALRTDLDDEKHFIGDAVILEDEQRAIGEVMLTNDATPTVIGYARFSKELFGVPSEGLPTEAVPQDGHHSQKFQEFWIYRGTTHFLATPPEEHTNFPARLGRLNQIKADLEAFTKVLNSDEAPLPRSATRLTEAAGSTKATTTPIR